MGRLYLIRHGETEWNSQHLAQSYTDIPLSDVGRQQAHCTAKRLQNVDFDIAYASDLSRAKDTAEIILGTRNIQVNTSKNLREYNKGVFEGLHRSEYSLRYPDQYQASLTKNLDFSPNRVKVYDKSMIECLNLEYSLLPNTPMRIYSLPATEDLLGLWWFTFYRSPWKLRGN